MKELRESGKIDMAELQSRLRPYADTAVRIAKSARDTVRERAPSTDEVLKGIGLERRRSAWRGLFSWPVLVAAAVGAALVYFLDPDQGRRRRVMARNRLVGLSNDASRIAQRTGRVAGSTARGMAQRTASMRQSTPAFVNDANLVARIESEAFRGMDRDPKSWVNVNSVGGTVFIRGEVPTPEMINEIEDRVRRVRGVREVENLMHLPGTPAPSGR